MATIKAFSDLEQSKVLAKILPIESSDMTLPFRHIKNEYLPSHVVSRNYIEVYNDMIKLPGLDKEDIDNLIQPCWSLVALLGVLPNYQLQTQDDGTGILCSCNGKFNIVTADNPVDACVAMIEKLHELKML